ncbi:hypothetical protein PsorP6_002664 [Peronosclerospora sorghi]|uniref:Uncharacterized protein n=1 Tax=Peronosclerospora sorghi TaxID=230839 RepID=A0ACC0WW34_9STRA|nr:hypothetical protein PsorP6_002664 [Peronosclerospora sorghi]
MAIWWLKSGHQLLEDYIGEMEEALALTRIRKVVIDKQHPVGRGLVAANRHTLLKMLRHSLQHLLLACFPHFRLEYTVSVIKSLLLVEIIEGDAFI